MPSFIIPRRRQHSEDEDDGESSRASQDRSTLDSVSSQTAKRLRLSLNGDYGTSIGANQPSQRSSNSQEHLVMSASLPEAAVMEHQPGSIVRIKLTNFVTYSAVEFFPGPSLNMVIGPNGTGKSTLVCAICIGLGWDTVTLGRAKDIADYVKHGSRDATIEIELKGTSKDGHNPAVKCYIERKDNRCAYYINRKQVSKRKLQEWARRYSIQIDNLCQFLPQDKVVEFAQMKPTQLLVSTLRAVAPQGIIDQHTELIKLRKSQRQIELENAEDLERLDNMEKKQKNQEADVEKMREREEIKQRVEFLEAARAIPAYRASRKTSDELSLESKSAADELLAFQEESGPLLESIKEKQQYRETLKICVEERRNAQDLCSKVADGKAKKIAQLQDEINDLEKTKDAEIQGNKARKTEMKRLNGIITRLKRQMEDEPVAFDLPEYNGQIRDRERGCIELREQAGQLRGSIEELVGQGKEKQHCIEQAQVEMDHLESQAGQQSNKLRKFSYDTYKAWQWIQEHQGEFEKPVFGPPMIECSIKDSRYINQVEALFQKGDYITFTVQTRNDFNKLHEQVHQKLRLAFVNIRTMAGGLQEFRPPVSSEEARSYGLDGWALDYIQGPEPVLAMLCAEGPKLHQAAVALRDTTTQEYELIQRSALSSWVTSKSVYRINRRREYGPGATSTNVRDTHPAQVWTDQPVDLSAKRELQESVDRWETEIRGLQDEVERLKSQMQKIKERVLNLEKEAKELDLEKKAKQKALNEFKALPVRLSQNETKLDQCREQMESNKSRFNELVARQDLRALDKARAALDYVQSVTEFRKTNDNLYTAELMLIEATSDHQTLVDRSAHVQEQKKELQARVDKLRDALAKHKAESKRLVNEVKALQARRHQPGNEALDAFLDLFDRDQTSEQLEDEIESEKARLEMMHEADGGLISEFESRARKIERLKEKLEGVKAAIIELERNIQNLRNSWESHLDALIERISASFAYNMNQINCAGEVGLSKDDHDFEAWAIEIRVKFRETEPLSQLDAQRQSGGERAVSTIFYLMSLQTLTRSPFRVVDEINQGMDMRNERLVHARMVRIATGNDDMRFVVQGIDASSMPTHRNDGDTNSGHEDEDLYGDGVRPTASNGIVNKNHGKGSQYFLLTPKLLHGLHYERGMKVLCIASGELMPAGERISFEDCLKKKLELRGGRATNTWAQNTASRVMAAA
ncbi:Structural maintenance of chromosomes protein 5 [Agyrium rufum]|nr:Structural maintenance of chromosomes protein 5 [Agyrium rufum]